MEGICYDERRFIDDEVYTKETALPPFIVGRMAVLENRQRKEAGKRQCVERDSIPCTTILWRTTPPCYALTREGGSSGGSPSPNYPCALLQNPTALRPPHGYTLARRQRPPFQLHPHQRHPLSSSSLVTLPPTSILQQCHDSRRVLSIAERDTLRWGMLVSHIAMSNWLPRGGAQLSHPTDSTYRPPSVSPATQTLLSLSPPVSRLAAPPLRRPARLPSPPSPPASAAQATSPRSVASRTSTSSLVTRHWPTTRRTPSTTPSSMA
jgi:hypothetical protein